MKLKNYFRLIVIVNSALCLITLGMMLLITIITKENANPTSFQSDLFNSCSTIFKMSAGAFIGLLGGRASAPSKAD